jgi:hypothetical protein
LIASGRIFVVDLAEKFCQELATLPPTLSFSQTRKDAKMRHSRQKKFFFHINLPSDDIFENFSTY